MMTPTQWNRPNHPIAGKAARSCRRKAAKTLGHFKSDGSCHDWRRSSSRKAPSRKERESGAWLSRSISLVDHSIQSLMEVFSF